MKTLIQKRHIVAGLLLISALGLSACGGGSDTVEPADTNRFVTVTRRPPPPPDGSTISCIEGASLLRKASITLKGFKCAVLAGTDRSVFPPDDYEIFEISSLDLLAAEKLGFTFADEETLKRNFPRPFEFGSRAYYDKYSDILDTDIVVAKSLPPFGFGPSFGSSQREIDLLQKTGIKISSINCAELIIPGGFSPDGTNVLLGIAPTNMSAAEKLGFIVVPKNTLLTRFPRPFECVGRGY